MSRVVSTPEAHPAFGGGSKSARSHHAVLRVFNDTNPIVRQYLFFAKIISMKRQDLMIFFALQKAKNKNRLTGYCRN
jgi:hypothetical protein